MRRSGVVVAVAVLLAGAGSLVFLLNRGPGEEDRLRNLIESETLLLTLTPEMKRLSRGVRNLRLPGVRARQLFAERVHKIDLAPRKVDELRSQSEDFSVPDVQRFEWPISERVETSVADLDLWRPFLDDVRYVEHAKCYLVRAELTTAAFDELSTEAGVAMLAVGKDGVWRSVTGHLHLTWQRQEGTDGKSAADWRIAEWILEDFVVTESPRRLFVEVLDRVLVRPQDLARARHSQHERNIVEFFVKGPDKTRFPTVKPPYLDLDSTYQHPALCVVDIDRDGLDDLYVMARWGKNQLLRNRGDGTFVDIAPRIGLDIDGLSNSAVFADFDNDGDTDLLLARSLKPSVYLTNRGGRFSVEAQRFLPSLASSVSAADYNGDGLLDVYFSTYASTESGVTPQKWATDFFPPFVRDQVLRRVRTSHRFLSLVGPPNILLVNTGSSDARFAIAPEGEPLSVYFNTYQATWSDYDGDGDPDVYVCNDYAPDQMFRNDRVDGRVRFVEISREIAGDEMTGFGMGASWGDYDNDSQLDLYVSNMFSKAGRRLTAGVDGLDPRTPHAAKGSLLFRNHGGRLEQVAGLKAPRMRVAKVGWSFGGQFVDVDNDGHLDIYSASGFYTAPDEIGIDMDL